MYPFTSMGWLALAAVLIALAALQLAGNSKSIARARSREAVRLARFHAAQTLMDEAARVIAELDRGDTETASARINLDLRLSAAKLGMFWHKPTPLIGWANKVNAAVIALRDAHSADSASEATAKARLEAWEAIDAFAHSFRHRVGDRPS